MISHVYGEKEVTRKHAGIVALVVAALYCGFVYDLHHQNGIVHTTRKNGYGCLCHGFDPNPNVRVWISGPDSLRPGETGQYWIHVAKDSSIAGGFNVAAFRGSLGIIDSVGTQLMTESPGIDSLELTHTYPPRTAGGRDTISWVFSFRAPAVVGFVDTLYAVGNSVNLDVTPDGDAWNFSANFPVRVVSSTSVGEPVMPSAFMLLQNYPNPFNPSTRIRYSLGKAGFVSLRVFDVAGREVASLVNEVQDAGFTSVDFDGTSLPSGVYFYRLTSGNVTQTRKMLLLR